MGENNHFYGKTHTEESKIKISKTKSQYPIFVYSENKVLLYIFSSTKLLAGLIKANSSTITKAINQSSIFRGHWYLTKEPINKNENPLIKENSIELQNLIKEFIMHKLVKCAVYVYCAENKFINKYLSITEAEKVLGINHEIIKKCALSGETYNNYKFSYHPIN